MELVVLLFSIMAAVVPTIVYVLVVWWFDTHEREPLWLLGTVFLWGAVPAIIFSLIAEIVLDIPISLLVTAESASLLNAALVAPVVEEIAKAIPLAIVFWLYRHEFDGVVDGLLYGMLVGFGFAMTENVVYFLSAFSEGGWGNLGIVVFLRAIIFGFNHALFTGVTGAAFGYARLTQVQWRRWVVPLVGLALAIGLHMIHNFFVSIENGSLICLVSLVTDWLGLAAIAGAGIWAVRQESRWIQEELQEEVRAERLSAAEAQAAGDYRMRVREHVAAQRAGGRSAVAKLAARHEVAAELALKKRQLRLYGEERGNKATVEALQKRLLDLA
jgi:RsiW-degrading membrane proteinase PrsW (M82 family)